MPQTTKELIAVVGTACHFPGGSTTPSRLWELLKEPRDVLKTVPEDRFNADAWHHRDSGHHGTSNATKSYFLEEDPRVFDAQFFSVPPNECEAIDPQQRLLMESVYESLCAAGISMEGLRGSKTACYVGQMCDDWSGIMMRDWDSLPQYTATGISRSIMSNRISYFFDWHGPSMTIDTADSSSLVAVHEAVRFLRSGESKVAVACGSNLILSPGMYIAESRLEMASPDGRSRMWDEDANGYARGEGVAAVVLKTLSDALADGDHIECVIRETALNQDGKTAGLTMPSNIAHTELIRETYKRAGLDPAKDRPQFFQAHGTGTQAGDPEEAEAITKAFFGQGEQSDKLFVGSIKTVIGHTEGTAGLASLIGTSLALQNGTIPPNMHFSKLSQKVAPFYSYLEVPTSAQPWPEPRNGHPLRASVSSLGFGGTNAHAILERYDPEIHGKSVSTADAEVAPTALSTPLTFSANSQKSLRAMLISYSEYLQSKDTNLRDLAWTLQNRRSVLPFRLAISGKTKDEILNSIGSALSQDDKLGHQYTGTEKHQLSILGVFTGQGAQWPGMGRALLHASPHVRGLIAMMDESLQALPEADRPTWSIAEELEKKEASRVAEAAFSQPLCTAVQIILVELTRAAGIRFRAVVGHSSGEIGAAYAAGLVSARDAIRVAYYRGLYAKLAKGPSGKKGAMVAVGTSLEDAREFCELEAFEGRVTVAASNSAASTTLSGDEDAIDEAEEVFKDESKFARKLKVDTAYHSFHMEPCSGPYLQALEACGLASTHLESGATTWYSSVKPGAKMTTESMNSQYWVDNMENPVYFSQAVTAAVQDAGPFDVVLEVGPHPALKGPCLNNIEDASPEGSPAPPYVGLLSRGACDLNSFSSALGSLWEHFGPSAVDFDSCDKLISGESAAKKLATDLPTYPWNHDRAYWFESRVSGSYRHRQHSAHPLLGAQCAENSTGRQVQWRKVLHPHEVPWLAGHKLRGTTVFPVAGYVCAAIEALVAVAESPARLIEVVDFAAGRTISFPSESAAAQEIAFTLKFAEDASAGDRLSATFQVSSCPQGERAMHLNAQGKVVLHLGQQNPALISTTKLAEYNMVDVDADRFYDSLARLGHHYSPPFKAISSLRRRLDHAVGQLSEVRRGAHAGWADRLLLHPALLDSCLQTVLAAYSAPGDERLWTLHVPTRIERLALNPALAAPEEERLVWPWQTVVTSTRGGTVSADIEVFSAYEGGGGGGGDVFLALEGVKMEPLAQASPADDCRLFSNFVYELAQPEGGKADVAGEVDERMAQDSERFAFYWIRQTLASVTAEEEAGALQHHKRMLAWFRFSHDQVAKGQHPHVKPSALQDTESQVEALVAAHASRADIKLIRVVGKNLPAVIANGGDNNNNNIAEHMSKGGLLDALYEEGTRSMARIALQLTHRYPRARIIEVGGGSTCGLADLLGESFASYTVTDSSRTARQRFRDDGRFVFKALDLERDVVEQEFEEGAYDFVFTSNALYASDDIMRNVRKLVRPGGWLVDLETLPYFRSALAMAGSPGWWSFGAESGSPSVDEWDKIYRRTGWSGVDTFASNLDGLYPFTVLVTQAVDERVNYLRAPLAIPQPDVTAKPDELVLVDGRSEEVAGIAERITELLSDHFASITRVESVEEFVDGSSQVKPVLLNLGELDVPVMQELFEQGQADRLEALRAIFSAARDILWVTKNSRDESPFSRAAVGMAQALCKEYPTANFQVLDVDEIDSYTSPQVVAETLLRHAALRNWSKEKTDLLWSHEPELYIEDGKLLIPRLRSATYVNDRYNSSRRRITHEVPPSTQPVELVGINNNTWDLVLPSPLKQAPESTSSDTITLHVTHSLLHAVKIPMAGHYFLFHGTDPRTNDAYVALSATAASVVNVPLAWTIPFKAVPKGPSIPAILLALAANLLAEPLLAALPASGTLLAHDPDPIIAAALAKQAAAGRGGGARSSKTRVYFTTTTTKNSAAKKPISGATWLVLDPLTPRRHLKKLLPRTITTFVDLSNRSSSGTDASPAEAREAALVSSIAALLPHGAVLASSGSGSGSGSNNGTSPFLLSNRVQPRTGGNFGGEAVGKVLASGWAKAKASSFAAAAPASAGGDLKDRVVSLASVPGYTARELRVVDWRADAVAAARVVPIDAENGGQLFKADATYLLVGLAGGVGWSIAQWMVQRGGARNVVLASSAPGKVDERWVDALEEEYGATVKAVSLDITDRDALHATYNKILRTMPPIAGVAHGAAVSIDGLFKDMDYEDLMAVLRPKILGAMNLDELFADEPLDFFVLFSSTAGVVGNVGQSNQIGANSFLEALALNRRNKRGLAASVMRISSLVGISGHSHVDEDVEQTNSTSFHGCRDISESDLHALFAEAIVRGRPRLSSSASSSPTATTTAVPSPLPSHELITGIVPIYTDGETPAPDYLRDVRLSHFVLERPVADAKDSQAEESSQQAHSSELARSPTTPVSPTKKPTTADEDAAKKAARAEMRASKKAAEEKARADKAAAAAAAKASASADRAAQRAAKKQDDAAKARAALLKTETAERMSFGQSRFWFLDQAIKDRTTFNIAISVRLEGRLRVKDVERAVQAVALRHEALRTRYFARGEYGEEPMQGVVHAAHAATVPFKRRQIRDEAEARSELEALRNRVWDLGAWEGMRVTLLSLKETVHFLLVGCHHIAMDGVSFQIFYADLEKAYKGQTLPVLPPASQYRTFAKLQREAWETGKMDDDLEYYRGIIPKDPKPLPLLPFAKVSSRVPLEKYGTHRVDVRIDAVFTGKIKAAARRLKSTTFHFYLAALQLLIFRLVGGDCDEVFIGVADANRTDAKFMGTLGFFLNLLPLRFVKGEAATFAEAVQQARNKVYGGLAHSKLPFDILLEKLDIPRSSAHTPLFQVFVDYRQGVQERQRYMGLKAAGEDWHLAKTGYDASLDIIENAAGDARLEIRLQEALYSESSARLLLQTYVHLIAQLAEDPEVDWAAPEIWPRGVIERSLSEGRGKTIDYKWAPTIAHRVDEIIAKQPSAPALKDGMRVLTYAQMDDRINAICASLVDAGVVKGDRIGVFQKPTTDWICSLLAIFRAGAVYMPLDTRTPVQRLAAIVADAQPKALLAHDETWADVAAVGTSCAHINISRISDTHAPMPNLATADSPAALLFTSGSTGTPKGIQNAHANIIRQLEGYSAHSGLDGGDAAYVLQQSAYSFDKSLEQIFVALAHGGALYVVPAHQRGDPLSITRIMADEGISFTATTPSEYLMWLRYARENLRRCVRWRRAVLGGEVVPGSLIKGFQELGLPVRLTNSYGPAEITMACAKGDLPYEEMRPGEPIMAGTVLPGYTAYVVDEELKPVPVNCPGEIVISGVGVSMGYLNNEELTGQKYLPCPWQPGTMYRTGDRGRLGGDGVLYCDGRLEGDSQIKLRGVRMELEDIESCIAQTAAGAVTSVVVSKRGDSEQDSEFLAAHVVLAPGTDKHILDRLRTTLPLPQYMIPAVMVPVKDLPMTAHFKINRKEAMALPVPDIKKVTVDTGALTPTEARLAGLWGELIPGLQSIDAGSPFFLSGGNSLMLVKLQAMIRKNLGASLRLIDLMENDTLGKMARVVEEAAGAGAIDWESETALPELPPSTGSVVFKHKDLTVMLTGVTGVLGRNMLAKLAADDRIAKIYAVAVRAPVEGRVTTQSDKVTILTGDLAQPRLGLDEASFKTLSEEVDVIFHAGANRSFWDSYYELRATNVHSVKEMVKIAAPRRVPIHFMSSGEVVVFGSGTAPVDGSDGYVSSKWAAEKVLQKAAAQAGIEVVVHRPIKSDQAEAAPAHALEELMALARQMGKRPALDGLSGTLGVVPLSQIVDELGEGLFDRSSGVHLLSHGSRFNVDIAEFAAAVAKDEEVMKLESMSALKWTGVAKKMGWSMFMLAQEIFMDKDGGRVVSKR